MKVAWQAKYSQTQQQISTIQVSKDSSTLNYMCACRGKSHLPITPMFQCVLKLWPQFISVASRSTLAGDELLEQGCSLLEHAVTPLNRCALLALYLCISRLKALQSHVRSSQNKGWPEISSVFRVKGFAQVLVQDECAHHDASFQLAFYNDWGQHDAAEITQN